MGPSMGVALAILDESAEEDDLRKDGVATDWLDPDPIRPRFACCKDVSGRAMLRTVPPMVLPGPAESMFGRDEDVGSKPNCDLAA